MKKTAAFLLAVIMMLTLAVPVFADGSVHHYTMVITRTTKETYEGQEKTNVTTAGNLNAQLYKLLDTDMQDRSLFDTMTVDFDYSDRTYTATAETLVGKNGFTYTSSNPAAVFLDSPTKYHASGLGESQITVTNANGEVVDSFTVTVGGAGSAKVLSAKCSKCGGEMGSIPHLMVCGHFSCQDGAEGHGYGQCGITGHFNCDGRDHGTCSNCLQPLCEGEHGVGVCQHVHSWVMGWTWGVVDYRWVQCPYYTCSTCGETTTIAPVWPYPYPCPWPWYGHEKPVPPEPKPLPAPEHGLK